MATTTPNLTTAEQVREVIAASIEQTEPQFTILRVLREKYNGKRYDKRVEKALEEATGVDLLTVKHYGWTEIQWRSGADNCFHCGIIIARCEKNVVIDADYIERENPSYFSAAVERNEKRYALLDSESACERLTTLVNDYLEAEAKLLAAYEYGAPFHVVSYSIRKKLLGEKC
jgi:hypothetical protein